MSTRKHPQQGFAPASDHPPGERYGPSRLEAACKRAIALGAYAYKNIESDPEERARKQAPAAFTPELPGIEHDNLRGPDYYH